MSFFRNLFSSKPKSNSPLRNPSTPSTKPAEPMIYAADSTHKLFFSLNPDFFHSTYNDLDANAQVIISSESKKSHQIIYPAKHKESNKWGVGEADYHQILLGTIQLGAMSQDECFLLLLVVAHNKEELENYLFSPTEIPALIAQKEFTENETKSFKKLTKNQVIVIVPPDIAHSDIPQIGIPVVSLKIPSPPMEAKDRQILSNTLYQMVTEASKVEQNPSLTLSTNVDRSIYRSKCRLNHLNELFADAPHIPSTLTSIINEYGDDGVDNSPPLVAIQNSSTSVRNR